MTFVPPPPTDPFAPVAKESLSDRLAIRELLTTAGRHLANDERLTAANTSFHRVIGVALGNSVLAQLLGVLGVLGELFVEEQRLILGIFGSRERDYQEHLDILDALERRAPALAAERMRAHL